MQRKTHRAVHVVLAAALSAASLAARAEGAAPDLAPEPASHVLRDDEVALPASHVHHHDATGGAHDHSGRNHLMLMAAPGAGSQGGGFVSAGVGYEYRLPYLQDLLGIGAMAELMFMSGHSPHPMLMAFGSIHPIGGLVLSTAVGAAHVHDDGDGTGKTRMSTKGVVRLSAGYDLHAGSVMLTPYVNADLGGSTSRAVSAGFCAGYMF